MVVLVTMLAVVAMETTHLQEFQSEIVFRLQKLSHVSLEDPLQGVSSCHGNIKDIVT